MTRRCIALCFIDWKCRCDCRSLDFADGGMISRRDFSFIAFSIVFLSFQHDVRDLCDIKIDGPKSEFVGEFVIRVKFTELFDKAMISKSFRNIQGRITIHVLCVKHMFVERL